MRKHKTSSTAQACGAQVASEVSTEPQYQQIKLALDVHAASIVVARMVDGAKPQPPQSFKPADFLVPCQYFHWLALMLLKLPEHFSENGARPA